MNKVFPGWMTVVVIAIVIIIALLMQPWHMQGPTHLVFSMPKL